MKLKKNLIFIFIFVQVMTLLSSKKHTVNRNIKDIADLPVLAHANSYGVEHKGKLFKDFFSIFEDIFEAGDKKEYRVSVGITSDPLPMDVDATGKSPRALIVVFRGTANLANIVADLEFDQQAHGGFAACKDCAIHGGFAKAYMLLRDKMLKKVEEMLTAASQNPNIVINHVIFTGHSLGGALANLGAYNFCFRRNRSKEERYKEDPRYKPFNVEHVSLITFGSPRVGNAEFKKYIDSEAGLTYNYRVIYNKDPVPSVPAKTIHSGLLEILSKHTYHFVHAGTEIRYNKDDFVTPIKNVDKSDTCDDDGVAWSALKGLWNKNDHSQYKFIKHKILWEAITGHKFNENIFYRNLNKNRKRRRKFIR